MARGTARRKRGPPSARSAAGGRTARSAGAARRRLPEDAPARSAGAARRRLPEDAPARSAGAARRRLPEDAPARSAGAARRRLPEDAPARSAGAARRRLPEDAPARNRELIRERLEYEIQIGLEFIEDEVGRLFAGHPLGVFLNPLARLFYRFAAKDAAIRRARRQLDLYMECAEKYNGRNLEELVEANFDRFLATEEIVARGNRRHPRWNEVRALEKEIFRERLKPLIRLAREGRGDTYGEMSRSVFPERREAEKVLQRQIEFVEKLLDLIRAEPGLAPIPPMLRPAVLKMLDSGVDFARKTLREQMDEIYKGS